MARRLILRVGGALVTPRPGLLAVAMVGVRADPFVASTPSAGFPSTSSRSSLSGTYGSYIPDVSRVGIRSRFEDLDEWNSPDTNEVVLTKNTTIQDKIVYGRIKKTPYVLETENVAAPGPKDPTIAGGETAIFDNDAVFLDSNGKTIRNHHLDTTVFMRNPHPRWNAFKGNGYRAERCHALWVTDGHGPYTKSGYSAATNVQIWGCRTEALINFPGTRYAAKGPLFWDPATGTYTSSSTYGRLAADKVPYFDDQHTDGTHNDGCEAHGGIGSHTMIDPSRDLWSGDGIDIWGNAWINNDPYGENADPAGKGLPVPAYLGDGANINRGIAQSPGMTRPVTGGWNNPLLNGRYAALGSAIIILQLVNQFPDPTTVLVHGNYMDMGGLGLQQQRKGYPTMQFTAYDNLYGPNWYMWRSLTQGDSSNRDIYPIRLYDATGPTDTSELQIYGDPRTGASWLSSQKWLDPENKWGRNGQAMVTGSSSVPGVRYAAA